MLETYFENTNTLNHHRAGPLGQYIDGFTQQLVELGYTKSTARRILNAAARLGQFVKLKTIDLTLVNPIKIDDFRQHLAQTDFKTPSKRTIDDISHGAKLFITYLYSISILKPPPDTQHEDQPALINAFRSWLIQHRGLSPSTVYKYCRDASKLLTTLGEDTAQFNAKTLRHFLLESAKQQGSGASKTMISALRTFLRYLISQNKCQTGLDTAIPRIAKWRNAALPNYLQPFEVQRILDTCDISTIMGLRDKAIILLLVRLGLRAGDVTNLKLADIDWQDGSIIVAGKNSREVRLPLSQEVGDAIFNYLKHRRPVVGDAVFIRTIAPYRPFNSNQITQYPLLSPEPCIKPL
jgi:site-specific recombinase XerC